MPIVFVLTEIQSCIVLFMRSQLSRRDFLAATVAPVAALSLLGLSQQRVAATETSTRKKLFVLWLSGGPSAKETFNPDPDGTPQEFRGPLGKIRTRTPGMQFSELFPRLADSSNTFSVLRAINAGTSDHTPGQVNAMLGSGRRTVAEISGDAATGNGVGYVLLNPGSDWPGLKTAFKMSDSLAPLWDREQRRFTQGQQAEPVEFDFAGGFVPPPPQRKVEKSIDQDRLQERRQLLTAFDKAQVHAEQARRYERFRSTAMDLTMGGGEFFRATQLADKDRERYGVGGKPTLEGDLLLTGKQFLDRGAGAVVAYHEPDAVTWDAHTNIAARYRMYAPAIDHAAATLLQDVLRTRDTVVVIMGEIARTPQINTSAGRDHWQHGNVAILAGGSIAAGAVHGETQRDGTAVRGEVQQRDQLGNTIRIACGEELGRTAPRVREILT